MPKIFDTKFNAEKRVSGKSGLMLNKLQRAYIDQFDTKTQTEYYTSLDEGKIGKFPKDIPDNLH
jgi:hypothetical protein